MYFYYDGLNRQVSRKIGTTGTPTFSVWDGWNLIEEYQAANNGATTAAYLYGAGGLISGVTNGQFAYYFQDASGSTSHVTDVNGSLLEWYRYDLQGAPVFYDAGDNEITASAYGVCYLFTGQQWRGELGLYDLRNRFYSPDIGRFLQPDPIGFDGDATNLYRYCRNNPLKFADPTGTTVQFSGNIAAINQAIGYLLGSTTFTAIYSSLQSSSVVYTITTGGYINSSFNQYSQTVYWDPSQGLAVSSGAGVMSPALVLAHELAGHGFDFEMVGLDQLNLDLNNADVPYGYDNLEEFHAGQAETIIGMELDEPSRADHRGTFVQVPTPTTSISGGRGINTRVRAIIDGIFYPWGFGNFSPGMNFGGGFAGTMTGGSAWNPAGWLGGLSPAAEGMWFAGNLAGQGLVGAGEPGLGCFVAGTSVSMADGSEKPIEAIQAGEAVLAWNDETRQTFPTRVIKPLHHEAKAQTLFDVELEDGRRFTVNNNHPIYVIEDDEFVLTRELSARFANGQPFTFQDNKGQPVTVANIHMRRQTCKVYNLEVEGQGKNGHTYYANGILVHNARAGLKWK